MKYGRDFLLLTGIVLTCIFKVFPQTPANDPHWQLVWGDDFNFFDNNRWVKADYCDHGGDPLIYLANNVSVSNGNLVIKVENTFAYCPINPPTPTSWACGDCIPGSNYQYTSGWVETKYPHNTQFGYIESRIKLPYGHGFFPAFWTWRGAGITTTNEAEIDIFEMLGSDLLSPYSVGTNMHTYYPDDNIFSEKLVSKGLDYTQWRTYGIEWSPNKIIWHIDGYSVRVSPNPGILDPVRIILNLAIEPWALPDQSTPFPSEMLVDYVRVYELNNDCNTNMNVCNYDFSAHDNKVKKNITIGNGTCTNTITGQNIHLRASESVLINGDFSISPGSELYIDVNSCY